MKSICSRIPGVAVLMVMILSLVGCGTPPKNSAEFREMAKGSMFLSNESYVVKRPFQQVVDSYRQRAPACLNKTIESSWWEGGMPRIKHTEIRAWTARVNATNKHMECTLQWRVTGGNTIVVGEYPNKDGHYYILVDAYAVDQNSTRIVLSKGVGTSDALILATKNWATGANMGCPDMTQ